MLTDRFLTSGTVVGTCPTKVPLVGFLSRRMRAVCVSTATDARRDGARSAAGTDSGRSPHP